MIPAEDPPFQESLLDDDEFCDFKIICENQQFKVHKCVLALASPVFHAMFQHECQEKEKNEVVITDFKVATIQAGINLIYKKELDENLQVETLLELLKFVDKYDIKNKGCEMSDFIVGSLMISVNI
uniref:BTB domain-containing protein n=1 Tax=Panagrolaimus sp. JU765 TaxID=591449 RepID=A0AC34RRG1_9BILA